MTDAVQRPAAGEGRLNLPMGQVTLSRTGLILLVALVTTALWGAILHLAGAIFAFSISPIAVLSILAGIFLLLVFGLSIVIGPGSCR